MRSNYRPIGEFIRLVENNRNTDLKVTRLLGLSMTKEFRETTSNIVGTDMSVYKVMQKWQFACDFMSPIRVYKLPVVLKMDDEPNIVSPAYPVFEIKDRNELDPEYLMMWFRRPEFDRYATFKCDSAIRGGYDWEELCNTEIPMPHIGKQREIVAEYNTILRHIDMNNGLIQKLEETAQAIYKQWFVDFEFPNDNGESYKSTGGEMVESELGDIPKGWEYTTLASLVNTQYGYTASAEMKNIGPKFLRITDIAKDHIDWDNVPHCKMPDKEIGKYLLKTGDIVIARTGATSGYAKRINKKHPKSVFASYLVRMTAKQDSLSLYLGLTVDSNKYRDFIQSNIEGSAQPQANASLMSEYSLVKPSEPIAMKFNDLAEPILDQKEIYQLQNTKLNAFSDLMLSKLATVTD